MNFHNKMTKIIFQQNFTVYICVLLFLANYLSRIMTDKIGRKQCIVIASIIKVIGAIALIFANEVWIFILCRTVILMFDCCIFTIIPVYASEIANVSIL